MTLAPTRSPDLFRRCAPPGLVVIALAAVLAGCAAGQATSAVPNSSTPLVTPTGVVSSTASPAGSATCTAPEAPTEAQTEGPYFKAGSPERSSLIEPGVTGTALTFSGYVLSTTCLPIAGATIDVWRADATGAYDNAGYRLRGHVLTDAAGGFTVETIVPGEYPGRTEHIHVKVTPPGGATLTTQVYFPGVAANTADGIYSPSMLLDVTPSGSAFVGAFTFVLPTG